MKIHESARRQGEPFTTKVSCRFLFAQTKATDNQRLNQRKEKLLCAKTTILN